MRRCCRRAGALVVASAAVAAAAGSAPRPSYAQGSDLPSYTGTGSCGSAQCHGSQQPRTAMRVRQNEYVTWILKDNHAKAFRTLLEERSARIARNLRLGEPPERSDRCLGCHAVNVDTSRRGRTFDLSDGVSCEGCHGPAEKWLGPHTTPGWTHKQSVLAGMYDTKSVVARAEKCLSCHAGDERKSVDHELIAAGHPDLVFELDTFSAAMPAHWRETEDKGAWFGARAWAVGQAVAVRESMERLARRSVSEGWPEFAEYECFACHHDLRKDSWRQARGWTGRAGLPSWNTARHAVFRLMLKQEAPSDAASVENDLRALGGLMASGGRDVGTIAATAGRIASVMDSFSARLADPAWSPSADRTRNLIRAIASEADALADAGYRVAEQATMAVDSLYRPLARVSKPASDPAVRKAIDRLFDDLKDPARYDPRAFAADLKAVSKLLS